MEMTIKMDYTEKICVTCGCVYYVPDEVIRVRNESKDNFFCFNGHPQQVIKSTSERLKEEYEKKLSYKSKILDERWGEIAQLRRERDALKDKYEPVVKKVHGNTGKRKARMVEV